MFDIPGTFEFRRPTNLVCSHGIGEYLFSLLSGVLVVKHGSSDFILSLFNEVYGVCNFTLSVEILTLDCFDILELVAYFSH